MILGLGIGSTAGILLGGLVVANIIGFPEFEAGEGIFAITGGADVVANGGLLGGTLFGGLGMIGGLASTRPTCPGGGS